MTDHGVYDDGQPEPVDMPLCPVCPPGRPWAVQVTSAGLHCANCNTVFAGTPGEMQHPRNVARRRVAAQYARDEEAAARAAMEGAA